MSEGFSGAEIEEAIISGLYDAFSNGHRPRHRDAPRGDRRDGAAFPDHERGAEPPAQLGAGPRPAFNRAAAGSPSSTPPRPGASWRSNRGLAAGGIFLAASRASLPGRPPYEHCPCRDPSRRGLLAADVGGDHRRGRHHGLRRRTEQGPARSPDRRLAKTRTEIELEDSEILAGSAGTGEQMVVERDGIRAIFSRDARVRSSFASKGHGHSKAELKRIGEALVGRVTQQYAYHRSMSELKERRMTIIEERVDEDQAIHIRVRTG